MQVLGIDASPNVVKIANSKGIETFEGFFDEKMVEKIISSKQKAKVITATNLFAHIQNYFYFTKSLKNLISLYDLVFLKIYQTVDSKRTERRGIKVGHWIEKF